MPNFAEKLDDVLVKYLAYFNYRSYVGRIKLHGNEKVLELGSGGGNLSRFLAERLPHGKLVCIDNSEYWIEKAKKRLTKFENINFILEDILDFDKENYFDVAVVHYVLHDIQKDKRKKAVEILNRSLKEGGRVYIREPMRKNHGMPRDEISSLMNSKRFLEQISREGHFFPLRGRVYEGVFQKLK